MSDAAKQALGEIAARNQITVIADLDHSSESIKAGIARQLPAMAASGVRHLFLEHDSSEVSTFDIIADGGAYAELVREAQALGIAIHMMDDRTLQRERAIKFPEEDEYRRKYDQYITDPEKLVETAPNPERMKEYLDDKANKMNAEMKFRNDRMVDSIARTMQAHPNEKAAIIVGAAHVYERQDMDEGLRAKGYQTATAHIYSRDIMGDGLISSAGAYDKSDFIVDDITGEIISHKTPGTNTMRTMQNMPEGTEILWKNTEPVAPRPSGAMGNAQAAAAQVDCSWKSAASRPPEAVCRGQTGQMEAPLTQGQFVASHAKGPAL